MYIFAFIKLVLNWQIVRFCFTILPEDVLCMIIAPSEGLLCLGIPKTGINLADDRDLIVRYKFFCTIEIWTMRVMRPCPENKWPLSPAPQNAWEGLSYKANIGPGTNK